MMADITMLEADPLPSSPSPSSSSSSSASSSRANTHRNSPDPEDVTTYQDLMSRLFPPGSLPPPPIQTVSASNKSVAAQKKPVRSGTKIDLDLGNGREEEAEGEEDSGLVDDGAGGKRAMTKADKQNAKKKRRKERDRLAKAAAEREEEIRAEQERAKIREDQEKEAMPTVVPFRLFSACPIQPVSIVNALEEYPIPSNPRHRGLNQSQRESITKAARESAAGFSDLFDAAAPIPSYASLASSSFTSTSISNGREHRMLYPVEGATVISLPGTFIASLPRDQPKLQFITKHDDLSNKSQVSPVKVGKRTFPFIELSDTPHKRQHDRVSVKPQHPSDGFKRMGKKKARTRRGRTSSTLTDKVKARRIRARPPPRFWAPPVGIGGKARGYAWGYRDSMEGRREDGAWNGYVRSKDR